MICKRAEETSTDLLVEVALASEAPQNAVLSGVVHGPYSRRARTLPATFVLQPAGKTRLELTIIDPCYSTDELDMHYEVELELTLDGQRISEHVAPLVLCRRVCDSASSANELM